MEDCIFCKITAGEIPTTKIYEDELCFASRILSRWLPPIFLCPQAACRLCRRDRPGDGACNRAHLWGHRKAQP